MTENSILTVPEAAKILRVTPTRAYELIREKILPGFKLGRQVRVNRSVLEKFIAAGGASLPNGWKRN